MTEKLTPPRAILVVEDDELMARVYLSFFERLAAEFSATVVGDGESAVERLRARRFDAVVVDWDLPRLDGLRVIAHLRADPRHRGTRVFMASGRRDPADRARALAGGADEYLVKPFPLERLLERLRALLGSADRDRGARF